MTTQQRKKSMHTYGTNYKRWTIFFPKQLREEVYLLYAFVRHADNLVDDTNHTHEQAYEALQTLQQQFTNSYAWRASDNILIDTFSILCKQKNIEAKRVMDFFTAMITDTHTAYYETYEQLHWYMRWSAEVIWLMMTQLIWYDTHKKETTLAHAKILWEAMQYTNFLRDIKEDWLDHNRIYIPSKRLQKHNLWHEDIKTFCAWEPVTESRKRFLKKEIAFCRTLYREANKGIRYLHKRWRFAVKLASHLYEWILDTIEKNNYDPFRYDCHTTKWKKAKIAWNVLVSHIFYWK